MTKQHAGIVLMTSRLRHRATRKSVTASQKTALPTSKLIKMHFGSQFQPSSGVDGGGVSEDTLGGVSSVGVSLTEGVAERCCSSL